MQSRNDIFYSKQDFFRGTFLIGQYLKPINGRIDNKMTVFSSVSCSRILRTSRKKTSSVGATGEEIFLFNCRIDRGNNEVHFLGITFGLTQIKKRCHGRIKHHRF